MKRRNRAQTSSLFLLELILAILFFSLASAVCVQFFVRSHLLNRDARVLNCAVSECAGIAELVNTSDDVEKVAERIRAVYPQAQTTADGLAIYYDRDLQVCDAGSGSYVLQAEFSQEEGMLQAQLSMKETEEEADIYTLAVKHHLQRRTGDEEE